MNGTATVSINDSATAVSVRASIDGTPLQITVDLTDPDGVDQMGKMLREFARRMRAVRKAARPGKR